MMTFIHGRVADSTLFFFVALGLWAFWIYWTKRRITSSFWGALAIGELLVVAQGVLGGVMWLFGELRPGRGGFHALYGVVALMIIPMVYFYTKGGEERRDAAMYAAALLFGAGILLRAVATG